MSYSPKNWLPGEAIIAEDMNNIELGIQEALKKVAILDGSVKYNEQQVLTDEQQRNAIVNIGAIGTQAGLFYTESQKERAREYIGALGESELNSATDALVVEINKLANNISGQYNPPYSKGDYALIDGVLKKALRDIAANDTYNAGYWTSVLLTGELGHPVRYDAAQSLTASQATQALKNIGAIGIFSNLGYSDAQKTIARNNIDAANNSDFLLLQQNVTTMQASLLSNTNSISSLERRVAYLELGGRIGADEDDSGSTPGGGGSESGGASSEEVEALKVRVTAVESNITSLNTRLTTTNNNVSTLSSTVSDIEDTVQSYDGNFEEIMNRLENLEYEEITISSLGVSPNLVEKGSTVSQVTLNYSINKVPTSATIDGVAYTINNKTGSITLQNLNLANDKTWTLNVRDEKNVTSSKNVKLTFANKIYYGVAAAPTTINDTFLLGLVNKVLATSRAKTFTVNAGSNQYIWYAVPSSFGVCSFNVGGFEGGFTKVSTFNHTNASGGKTNYDVYRSDNINLGENTVIVS